MRGIRKAFGSTVALAGVDFDVRAGEVHALVGENGAGKSTLMKVLSGAVQPDGGDMRLSDAPYAPSGPLEARERGVAMIYQELSLAPHLTVEENVMLGREASRIGFVRRRSMRPEIERALALLHHEDIDHREKVAGLPLGARQVVELVRALCSKARVIVMDEPTSSLSRADQEQLFHVIGRLRDEGVAVVYISHFLEEVRRVADRVTVLRDGATVATAAVQEAPDSRIIEWMVGRRLEEIFPRVPREAGEVLLRVEGLAGPRLPRRASFELRRGEVLGITGLVGAGRTEMLRVLFGLDSMRAGRIEIAGRPAGRGGPARRLAQGMGLLPESRKDEGLASGLSVASNLTLSWMKPFARRGWLSLGARDRAAERWMRVLGIKARSPRAAVGELSGGNQQKTVLARLLHHDVDLLLLDEPTRGIDVASKVEIYRLMGELAARGKGVLFVSSYIPELLGVCDRIAVMHRGVLGESRPVSEWTEEKILARATGGAEVAG